MARKTRVYYSFGEFREIKWFSKRWTFVFLFLTTIPAVKGRSDVLAGLNSQLEANGIRSERISETASNVIFDEKPHEIYINEPERERFNTLTRTYVYLSCEAAKGIRDRLIGRIELLPLLYNKGFAPVHNVAFKKHLGRHGILGEVRRYAEKWIDLLMGVLDVHLAGHDASNNTDVLRVLLAFCYRMKAVKLEEDIYTDVEQLDAVVLANVLEMLYSIQTFAFFNCSVSYLDGKRNLYGLTFREFGRNEGDPNAVADVLRTLNVGNRKQCGAHQMILENKMSKKFGNVNWKTDLGDVPFGYVNMSSAIIMKDLDLIFWYQNLLLETIVKLTFSKTVDHYKRKKGMSGEIADKLKKFIGPVSGLGNFPTDVANCVALLTDRGHDAADPGDADFAKTVSSCAQSLSRVTVKKAGDDEPYQAGFVYVDSRLADLPIATLEDMIGYFDWIAADFECFLRLFRFLRGESDGYGVSRARRDATVGKFERELMEIVRTTQETKNESTVITYAEDDDLDRNKKARGKKKDKIVKDNKPVRGKPGVKKANADVQKKPDGGDDKTEDAGGENDQENDRARHGCNYFGGLYHYCFESMMFLNMARSNKTHDEKNRSLYFVRVKTVLTLVATFLEQLTAGYFDVPQFDVVYRVLPVLELVQSKKFAENHDDARRLISAVMAELNAYGAQNCTPPDFNFSFANNIDFGALGLTVKTYAVIESSMKSLKKTYNHVCGYFSVRELFKKFDKKSDSFRRYDGVIRLSWRGQMMSIVDVHNAVAHPLTDASALYSMYENYIKFSLAAVYFELHASYRFRNGQVDSAGYQLRFGSWNNKYSDRYRGIIEDITAFSERRDADEVERRLIGQFRSIGVPVDVGQWSAAAAAARDDAIDTRKNIDSVFDFTDIVNDHFDRNCVHGAKRSVVV